MASGLFGSGPQSNILQTVQSSYAGMLNAEKQKGVAMREAMGAFGQAIDPKTIGMNKFKKQFAEADWTKPSTYFEASKFISAFDPSGAMSMAQNGMQLQASQAPKAVVDDWVTSFRVIDGKKVQGVINKRTGDFKSSGGEGEAVGAGADGSLTSAQKNLTAYNIEVARLEEAYADDPNKLATELRDTRSLFNIDETVASQEYSKLKVAKLGEQQELYSDGLSTSAEQMATIDQSLELLDQGVYTGFAGDFVADITALGVSLGIAVPDAAAGSEQFRVNSMKNIMEWISGTKGAISEKEMALFAKASPSLSRTVEGNRLILSTAKRVAEWKQARSLAYNDWATAASDNGNVPNYLQGEQFIAKWEDDNEMSAPTPADVAAAKRGTQVTNTKGLDLKQVDVTEQFVTTPSNEGSEPKSQTDRFRSKVTEGELTSFDNYIAEEGVTGLLWKYMTPDEKALYK
tara:strand:+ start:4153 stop:5529 length:1377 start_codon:yes stop_codon:yes gene_type:complete